MKPQRSDLIYLLPNFFTASSIFSGIYSIVSAIEANFTLSAWLIILALIFDGLDGRIARATNTCSRFGVEFDSLADIVSFGVAPSILMYLFVGEEFGRFGVVASALFVIFGAIRLARFNVMTSKTEPSVFIGVPIPTAAVFISVLVLFFQKYEFQSSIGVLIPILSIFISLLMVSNIRYPSFKKVDFSPKYLMKLFVAILSISLLIFMFPIEGFFTLFIVYILYGPIRAIGIFLKLKK